MPEGPHSEAAAVAVSANNRCSLPRTASTSALPSDALCEDSCPAESFFPSMENEDESPGYMDEPRLSIAELAAKFKAMLRIEKKYLVRGDGGRESPTNNQYGFSEKWRSRIVDWEYQVIDHYNYKREVVAVSMNILDRFCVKTNNMSKKSFQLAAMSSLYMAMKLHEPMYMRLSELVRLSRGCFTGKHVNMMEGVILDHLKWQTSPPTPAAFVHYLGMMLSVDPTSLLNILEVATFLTELAICDCYFMTMKASTIGITCMLAAFDTFPITPSELTAFATSVKEVCNMDFDDAEIVACKAKLTVLSQTFEDDTPEVAVDYNESNTEPSSRRNSHSPTGVVEAEAYFSNDALAQSSSSGSICEKDACGGTEEDRNSNGVPEKDAGDANNYCKDSSDNANTGGEGPSIKRRKAQEVVLNGEQ